MGLNSRVEQVLVLHLEQFDPFRKKPSIQRKEQLFELNGSAKEKTEFSGIRFVQGKHAVSEFLERTQLERNIPGPQELELQGPRKPCKKSVKLSPGTSDEFVTKLRDKFEGSPAIGLEMFTARL